MTRRRHSRRHGVALLLTLFALAIATVLSITFLGSQSTTLGIAQNLVDHAQARAVAEGGLEVVLRRVETDADWRADYAADAWAGSLSGGAFDVVAEDGLDTDGDGVIDADEGDGDLTDDNEDPVTFTVVGTFRGVSHRVRAAVTPEVQAGVATHGLTVNASIRIRNNGRIDAFDSSAGTYNPNSNSNTPARVATNTTGDGQVELDNSGKLVGDIEVGPGADPDDVIRIKNAAKITGARETLDEVQEIPEIPLPSPIPATTSSWTSPNNGSGTRTAGVYGFKSFTVKNNYTLNISGDVTIYCSVEFAIDNNAKVQLNEGATLTVYAPAFELKNNGKLNMTNPPTPANVTLYQTGSGDLAIDNQFHVAARVVAPSAKLVIKNNGRLFGSFAGEAVEIDNQGRFTQDLALTGSAGGGGGGSSVTYASRWVEDP